MLAVKYSTVLPPEEVLKREIENQKELYRQQMAETEGLSLSEKKSPKKSRGR